MPYKMNRRAFLQATVVTTAASLLAACRPGVPAPAPTGAPTAAPTATTAPAAATSSATAAPAGTPAPATVPIPNGFVLDAPDKPAPLGWKTTMVAPPKVYDPVVEITQNMDLSPDVRFVEGDSVEDNIATRWDEAMMGIRYRPKWSTQSGDAADAKWATAMAANDLPDFMVWLTGVRLQQLLDAGSLEDITEIWEKTASPELKKVKRYPDHPIWEFARKDGRLYGIAFSSGFDYCSEAILWIRQDWLDQVGMQVPQTIDEFHAVGKAFMDKGLARMGCSLCSELVPDWNGYMCSADPIFGAYGTMPGKWMEDGSGKLVYGTVAPGCKEVLALLREWYKEGFLSADFPTIPVDKSGDAIVDGGTGMFFGQFWVPEWPLPDSVSRDPQAKWVYAGTPAGPGGKRGRAGTELAGNISAFRKGIDPIKIEASINHLNWRVEREQHAYDNKDYLMFVGYDVAWDGDNLVTGEELTKIFEPGAGGYPTFFQFENPALVMRPQVTARDPSTWNAAERYLFGADIWVQEYGSLDLIVKSDAEGVHTAFYGAPGPVMKEKWAQLNQLEKESYVKIIAGQLSLDDFDRFVADWYKQGGQEVTDEVNAWYAARKS